MTTLGLWLGEAAASAPYSYVAVATILWFTAIYVARILDQPHNLVLHGLASEMLYELLVRAKRAAAN